MKIWVLILCLVFIGCAPTVTPFTLALGNPPVDCDGAEVRPSMLSTLTVIACRDKEGKVVGFGYGPGKPSVDVAIAILQAGTLIGGAKILAQGLVDAGGNIEKPWPSRVEFPDND